MKPHTMVKCDRCDGHGIVQAWVNIPDECPDCGGSGRICQYPSGALARYYGGPLLSGPLLRADAAQ